jgi:hypothetical protein
MEQGKERPRGEAPCGLGCGDARERCRSHHHTRPVLCCTALSLFAARTGSRLHPVLGVLQTRRCLIKPCPAAAKSLQGEALYHTLIHPPSYFLPSSCHLYVHTTRRRRPVHRPRAFLARARARVVGSSARLCVPPSTRGERKQAPADADASGEVSAIRRSSCLHPRTSAGERTIAGRASRRVQRPSPCAALRTADGRARRRRSKDRDGDGERGGRAGARLLHPTPARTRAARRRGRRTRGERKQGGGRKERRTPCWLRKEREDAMGFAVPGV